MNYLIIFTLLMLLLLLILFGLYNIAVEIHDIMLCEKSKNRAVMMDNHQALPTARLRKYIWCAI